MELAGVTKFISTFSSETVSSESQFISSFLDSSFFDSTVGVFTGSFLTSFVFLILPIWRLPLFFPLCSNSESLEMIKSLQILMFVNTIPARTKQIKTSCENSSVQTVDMMFLKRIRFIKISNFLSIKIWKPL